MGSLWNELTSPIFERFSPLPEHEDINISTKQHLDTLFSEHAIYFSGGQPSSVWDRPTMISELSVSYTSGLNICKLSHHSPEEWHCVKASLFSKEALHFSPYIQSKLEQTTGIFKFKNQWCQDRKWWFVVVWFSWQEVCKIFAKFLLHVYLFFAQLEYSIVRDVVCVWRVMYKVDQGLSSCHSLA